jgi:predicted enzyme related to lactoylglutathione lyase
MSHAAEATTGRYLPGVPCWIELDSTDPGSSAEFYAGVFGWELRPPPEGPGDYLVAHLDGAPVAGIATRDGDADDRAPAAWRTYVATADLDTTTEAVTAAGGTVLTPARDVAGLARAGLYADRSGAVIGAWQAEALDGAARVNEPNSWNFNTLRAPALKEAMAFYTDVFGWQAREVDFGVVTATMWCLPGYGEHLDSRDPGWLQGHLDRGSPPGFVDVVAWFEELPPTPGRHGGGTWSVELNVTDTRELTERVSRLGGTVEAGPQEADGLWTALLRDPQGATFAVNDFG